MSPTAPKNPFARAFAVVAPGNAAAMQVLDSNLQLRLVNPTLHSKAGRVCLRMAAAKHSREETLLANPDPICTSSLLSLLTYFQDINAVVLALVARSDAEMEGTDLFCDATGITAPTAPHCGHAQPDALLKTSLT